MSDTAQTKENYFKQVVSITERYLGPASERFIRRQIEFHLQKEPENISYEDVSKLSNNVGVALGLLVNDKSVVSQAVSELKQIQK